MTCQVTGTSHEINRNLGATPVSWWLRSRVLSHTHVLKGEGGRNAAGEGEFYQQMTTCPPTIIETGSVRYQVPPHLFQTEAGYLRLHQGTLVPTLALCDRSFLIVGNSQPALPFPTSREDSRKAKSVTGRHQCPPAVSVETPYSSQEQVYPLLQ